MKILPYKQSLQSIGIGWAEWSAVSNQPFFERVEFLDIDLTDITAISAKIKKLPGSDSSLASFSTLPIFMDGTTSVLEVSLSEAILATLPFSTYNYEKTNTLFWDLVMVLNGRSRTYLSGTFIVNEGITL